MLYHRRISWTDDSIHLIVRVVGLHSRWLTNIFALLWRTSYRLVWYYVGCRPLTTSRLSLFLISLTMALGGHHFFSFLNWHPLIVLHSFKPRFLPAVNHSLLIPLWWLHALLFLNHLMYAFLSIFFPTLTWLMWIVEPWTATSCTLIFHHAFCTTASPGKCTPE